MINHFFTAMSAAGAAAVISDPTHGAADTVQLMFSVLLLAITIRLQMTDP